MDSRLSTGPVDNLRTHVDDTRAVVDAPWTELWKTSLIASTQAADLRECRTHPVDGEYFAIAVVHLSDIWMMPVALSTSASEARFGPLIHTTMHR
jgi:hypothetical protein